LGWDYKTSGVSFTRIARFSGNYLPNLSARCPLYYGRDFHSDHNTYEPHTDGEYSQAASLDSTMLSALGFNVPIIYSLTFVGGAALAAISGVVMSPIYFVYPLMGMDIILRVFIVVIVGGLGSIKGAFIAGILIGKSNL